MTREDMTREEAIEFGNTILMFAEQEKDSHTYEFTKMAVEALSAEPCEQIKWERDTAIAQLKELGFGLGEKPRTSEDCISRKEAIKAMEDKAKGLKNLDTINGLCGAVAILYELPSVQPICEEKDQGKCPYYSG